MLLESTPNIYWALSFFFFALKVIIHRLSRLSETSQGQSTHDLTCSILKIITFPAHSTPIACKHNKGWVGKKEKGKIEANLFLIPNIAVY